MGEEKSKEEKMYNDRGHQRGRYQGGSRAPQPKYEFKELFFLQDKSLNPLWVGEEAKRFSEFLANQRDGAMTTSSLRNFYNEFLRIKNLPVRENEEKIILVKLLAAKANYKKNTAKIHPDFVNFINKLIDSIGDDLNLFNKSCYIIEALVGYNPKK
jgi:CRISPR type III-A-associated protein Csm2